MRYQEIETALLYEWANNTLKDVVVSETAEEAWNMVHKQGSKILQDFENGTSKDDCLERMENLIIEIKVLFKTEHDSDAPDRNEIDGYKGVFFTLSNMKKLIENEA